MDLGVRTQNLKAMQRRYDPVSEKSVGYADRKAYGELSFGGSVCGYYLHLPHLYLPVGILDMVEELLSLGCQLNAFIGPCKQLTVKLCLQIIHCARNIGLAVVQGFGSLAEAHVLADLIKDFIIIV